MLDKESIKYSSYIRIDDMKKNLLLAGMILLVVGLVLIPLGPSLFTTNPEKVAADMNPSTLKYGSYSPADTITAYGKIVGVHPVNSADGTEYIYGMESTLGSREDDNTLLFVSGKKVGEVGDMVVLKMELREGADFEYWEVTERISPGIYMLPGIASALMGAFLLVTDHREEKKRREYIPKAGGPEIVMEITLYFYLAAVILVSLLAILGVIGVISYEIMEIGVVIFMAAALAVMILSAILRAMAREKMERKH